MAKESSSLDKGTPVETAQLASLAALAGGESGLGNQVQAALLAFITEQSRRQATADAAAEAKRLKDAAIDRETRRDVVDAVRKTEETVRANQDACTHRWDAPHQNQTNVVGAYMVSGKLYLTCQACGRVFDGKEGFEYVNRNGLMPKGDQIAGRPVAN